MSVQGAQSKRKRSGKGKRAAYNSLAACLNDVRHLWDDRSTYDAAGEELGIPAASEQSEQQYEDGDENGEENGNRFSNTNDIAARKPRHKRQRKQKPGEVDVASLTSAPVAARKHVIFDDPCEDAQLEAHIESTEPSEAHHEAHAESTELSETHHAPLNSKRPRRRRRKRKKADAHNSVTGREATDPMDDQENYSHDTFNHNGEAFDEQSTGNYEEFSTHNANADIQETNSATYDDQQTHEANCSIQDVDENDDNQNGFDENYDDNQADEYYDEKENNVVGSKKNGGALKSKYERFKYDLFSRFDDGIMMDDVSWYSVTPEAIAEHIALRCASRVIIDAFCGAGGNTIQFAKTCERVIAIDTSLERLNCARHNARIYGVLDRIDFVLGDYISLIPHLKADVVFLSPPWGGPSYKKKAKFDIDSIVLPNGITGLEILRRTFTITPNVCYYLPRNVDETALLSIVSSLEIERQHLRQFEKSVSAYFGNLI